MRISDWSSDVCSSDLAALAEIVPDFEKEAFMEAAAKADDPYEVLRHQLPEDVGRAIEAKRLSGVIIERERWRHYRSEARRGGKECVSTCRYRVATDH